MPWTNTDYWGWLHDESKVIRGDVVWNLDKNKWPASELRVQVENEEGTPAHIQGFHNPKSQKTTFAVIHGGNFRFYGMCIGPSIKHDGVRGLHKHKWSVQHGAREIYVPDDITADWDNPKKLFVEFCNEAKIRIEGTVGSPPEHEPEMFL